MIFIEKQIILKNGIEAKLRNPKIQDSLEMLKFLKTCCSETDFLLSYGEEFELSPEAIAREENFLQGVNSSDTTVMICCIVNNEIAANCHIQFNSKLKTKHRASLGIAIVKKYWGLGIGTALMQELIDIASHRGVRQIELDFVEGNIRAQKLYEKLGFKVVCEKPDAIMLKNTKLLKEYSMLKLL